jgi:hypothetical protein
MLLCQILPCCLVAWLIMLIGSDETSLPSSANGEAMGSNVVRSMIRRAQYSPHSPHELCERLDLGGHPRDDRFLIA